MPDTDPASTADHDAVTPAAGSFVVRAPYAPSGDQPEAITGIASRFDAGERHVVLHGATGTGKSATTAWMIEKIGRPTLVLAPNKTLAAQLAAELRELLPDNAVCYFVSYFSFYRPEAYIPATDTFIEKDSAVDAEIDLLRHEATAALLSRDDVVVVASVSTIYGLGRPDEYRKRCLTLHPGDTVDRDQFLRHLVDMGYDRNDQVLERGRFRVRGDTIDIFPAFSRDLVRIELFGDEIDRLVRIDPTTVEVTDTPPVVLLFPATHHVADPDYFAAALGSIRAELADRLAELRAEEKLVEAQRLEQRTLADLEALETTGFCKSIEHYSRHFDGRTAGQPPACLLDYFPDGFLTVIDESHVTVPQLHAMYEGDRSRKQTLVEHGFRLPSALDNRPLRGEEFFRQTGPVLYLSATPGPWEREHAESPFVEQVIRPTGLLDPEVEIRPREGCVADLTVEIRARVERDERTLVTTLTKRMSEQLADHLSGEGLKVTYLHSDVSTLERLQTLRGLRTGEVDVVVGVNLLREGLDLPEVSLVAVLDADTEGFLRSETSLVQTIGRAARNPDGRVILYADKVTPAMHAAIGETTRRRAKQQAHNEATGQDPQPLHKKILDLVKHAPQEQGSSRRRPTTKFVDRTDIDDVGAELDRLTNLMNDAARELRFEEAALLRDEVSRLRLAMDDADQEPTT